MTINKYFYKLQMLYYDRTDRFDVNKTSKSKELL